MTCYRVAKWFKDEEGKDNCLDVGILVLRDDGQAGVLFVGCAIPDGDYLVIQLVAPMSPSALKEEES
jgi:hypothetical protein